MYKTMHKFDANGIERRIPRIQINPLHTSRNILFTLLVLVVLVVLIVLVILVTLLNYLCYLQMTELYIPYSIRMYIMGDPFDKRYVTQDTSKYVSNDLDGV